MELEALGTLLERGQIAGKVTADSRKVESGDVFVAVKGTAVDGHEFIEAAAQKGAAYIVCEKPVAVAGAKVVVTEDSHGAWGMLAQASQGYPGRKLGCLAVTGTNGKTTTTYLVRSIMQAAGHKCGLIGTVTYDTGNGAVESNMTTPDASSLASMMNEMVNAGSKYMVIEASSHALSQRRLEGIPFRAAAFTNLTGDHLDYHKDMKNYLDAKAVLFESLPANSYAIINAQTRVACELAGRTKAMVLTYAVDDKADIQAEVIEASSKHTVYELIYKGEEVRVVSPMLGRHNISNHLAAAGLCIGAGIDLKTIAKGLEAMEFVPGRLQGVRCGQDYAVLVDYAHTDDALSNVLETLRPICRGELTVVFGCGGDRDKTKRPRMAKVAYDVADKVVVTSDNPRTEMAGDIINDIMAGFAGHANGKIMVEADRAKAIGLAIGQAKTGDVILIAGKGHENYQIIGKEKIHFSDVEIAEAFIRGRK